MTNRRNQFHLQILNQKLNEHNSKLATLTSARDNLFTNDALLQDSHYLDLQQQKNSLAEQKQILESQMLDIKNLISKTRSDHASVTNQIKLIPSRLHTAQQHENNIYTEDLQSIENKIQEANVLYQTRLDKLEIEKITLADTIQEYHEQISACNDTITTIQECAHGFRKNTIQELKEKKQQKVTYQAMLDDHNLQRSIYTTTINNIQAEIDALVLLKSQSIDAFYRDGNISGLAIVTEMATPEEQLKTLVANIDEQIERKRNILANIANKSQKLERRLAAIQGSAVDVTIGNRGNNLGYKHEFKLVKQERDQLQHVLDSLSNKLANWEVEMVGAARMEYQNILDELTSDRARATQRLVVISTRLANDYESQHIALQTKLSEIETVLASASSNLQKTKTQIAQVEADIKLLSWDMSELTKLNNQIATLEDTIVKIKIDIDSLSIRMG